MLVLNPVHSVTALTSTVRPLLQTPAAAACLWISLLTVLSSVNEKLLYWVGIR